ncbi:GntR family transcriptional regulator [Streptomyces sp. LHD-70]|uniref:GntR family transcriptional regulator n=1 Tax=Streptomyces sp. LHD-70 TaxID=3072140 RepID=UPI00280C99F7|nr:GntR family transcriptional regulator [Streptomyces sp. LHD-70]MDQ8708026.1 GntR family transcriptional regulator [Streptomyces sp. LHD-70]
MTQNGPQPAASLTRTAWLRDQVCEELRDRIITGRLGPGDRLVERDLAEEFSVSRVPVREAIRILIAEGFLTAASPRRIVVKGYDRKDVENLFDLREALEVMAVRRAAERSDARGLATLKRLLENARRATLAGRPDRISRANAAFHHQIMELADNELLASTVEPLEGRLRWLFQQVDEPGTLWEEHNSLYQAIASGDADASAQASLHHVRHYREVALRMLFEEPDAGE